MILRKAKIEQQLDDRTTFIDTVWIAEDVIISILSRCKDLDYTIHILPETKAISPDDLTLAYFIFGVYKTTN